MKRLALRSAGVMAAVVFGTLLFLALRVPQGFSSLREKHQQIRQLQKENADLAREIAEKRERIRKLRDSRSEQELKVRELLKLQRKGETTVILPDQKPAQ